MSLLRVVCTYSPAFSQPNTWRLTEDRSSIKARFRLGSAPETIVETRLRCVRDKRTVPDAVWFAPLTSGMDAWLTAASDFDGQCGAAVAIQLNGAIDGVLGLLRSW